MGVPIGTCYRAESRVATDESDAGAAAAGAAAAAAAEATTPSPATMAARQQTSRTCGTLTRACTGPRPHSVLGRRLTQRFLRHHFGPTASAVCASHSGRNLGLFGRLLHL